MKIKMRFALLLLITVISLHCTQNNFKEPTIKIESIFGNIYVELYPDKAPKTVAGFLSFVDSGYFKNTSFYRILKREEQPSNAFKTDLIQGGLWETNLKLEQKIHGLPLETTKETGILHKTGVISLARSTPESGKTEFFICLGDQPVYDYGGEASNDKLGYAAFGKVVKGMDVVKKIHSQPYIGMAFETPVRIINIVRVK